jgi:hypothetical protein
MSKEPITLSIEQRAVVNAELCQAAIDSRDDPAPPRRPRLSKPPKVDDHPRLPGLEAEAA